MIYITHLIPFFNMHFNYVNEKGKRKGFQLFSNSELTTKLENLAVTLRANVQALVEDLNIQDATKAEQFIQLIKSTYETVLGFRKDYAKKASQFERELVFGLNGIINEYINIFPEFSVEPSSSQANGKQVGLVGNMIIYKLFKDNCKELIARINAGKSIIATESENLVSSNSENNSSDAMIGDRVISRITL